MRRREISVCRQTWALFCKNLLKKWRLKRESLMEWLGSLLLLLVLYLYPTSHEIHDFSSMPTINLGRVDSLNLSFNVIYTPFTSTTQQIMKKVASASIMNGREVFGVPNEKMIEEFKANYSLEIVSVIFTNDFSYDLNFFRGLYGVAHKEHKDRTAHCYETYFGNVDCGVTALWKSGFVALQAAINAAIIEVTTNHSVMKELMSATGQNMKIHRFVRQGGFVTDFCLFFLILSFSPFAYYACVNVTRERGETKASMATMGLRASAFRLSWGLLYGGFIFITTLFLALILKYVQYVILTGFLVVFTLFLLYGLSLVTLAFLMSVLLRKPFLTGLVVFLLTVFWGSLGFTALYRHIPTSLEWMLGFLSPYAFMLGMTQLLRVDYDMNSNAPPDPSSYSGQIVGTHFMLALDIFLYLALTVYFEKVLPNDYGRQHPPLFFLKSSFWSRQRDADHVALEDATDFGLSSDDSFEPVSPEFHGKEAIRIRNVTKEYKGKPDKIEALKDLAFDIYEGQITAVLGHSGAGKSTLLNILSGLSVPTKGSVTVYNNKLSEIADLENISKLIGVCPQFNVQFDYLTVRENLRFFAKIKGIQPQEVEQEIQRVLLELQMKNIQDVLAQNLSGGQKRKLTFGIAILGDPQVLLLDEPTAGLDPFSRHQVWNLLKERKMDRVILFSTQFMDEADLLADRKVFLSKGKLTCAGSSLFLKKKWGIGYHLSLQLNETCAQEKITSIVTQHIPDAKLSAASEGRLVYTLPLERTNKFPELYENLDLCPDLGIENYGVSMTTLNEVFLKLEGKSTIDEPDIATSGEAQAEGAADTDGLVEMEKLLSSLSETRETVGGMALWGQQILAIARVRLLKLKHERKALLSLLLILGIGFFPILIQYITWKIYEINYTLELAPHLYFLAPGQPPRDPLTQLLVINHTGASIDDFIHSVEHQNIALEVDASGSRNGLDDPSYNGAIIVSGQGKNYRFSLTCNTKRLNCFPVLVDIVSNGLLRMVKPSARIQTHRTILFPELYSSFEFVMPSMFWLLLSSSCVPYIAMSSIDDYKNRVGSQLRVSGLFPSAYWFGQALVDVPLYWLMFLFVYLLDLLLSPEDSIFYHLNQVLQIPCAMGYAISLIFFTYIISFIFRKGRKNSGIWSLGYFIITIFCVFLFVVDLPGHIAFYFVIFFIPQGTLVGSLLLSFYLLLFSSLEQAASEPFLILLIPFLQFVVLLFVLRCLEWKFGKKLMRKDPFFWFGEIKLDYFISGIRPNHKHLLPSGSPRPHPLHGYLRQRKPVIIASCLRKEYVKKKKHCFSKKTTKIATRNVSFCVRKGEVLGLLGHNGAGKSTSIRMITGDTKPTAGEVLLKGSSEGEPLGFLGYCPQENALWPSLTLREHLEVFAAVKGLRKADAKVAITRLVEALKLQDQQKRPVKALSQGIKRKLCFALSILGDPSVVLLDEPSTGMDPEGQQQMWQAIRATFKNTGRGALLTTHYMAEAEAVCDRVAIMVSGRLRCIGSIQHLKSRFGKDYLLEMKVKTLAQVEALHGEILRLFPLAARQERYSSLMVYKLPVEDVRPLAQAFFKLEKVKQSFDLEDYSLSQSTLEQVFLELSKEQELEDFDDELQPSMRWKLLPPDDS
ncbi:PREDICTED: ATP-binding cassette sub-family A member 8-like [Miniopterus natalensis]|uniref:ATP-binding cassette sub-family A member 8-like n=1 Tax=Miniopterus natalensis TaxID=291302 RepID=UPI0007A6BFF3|nr:PREDICTED: ATP-binding cassette sub-family A member 8-like [Miniopterus natalensis]